jgi:hypothetical protein
VWDFVPLVPVIVTVYVAAFVELLVVMTRLVEFVPLECSDRLCREERLRPLCETAEVRTIVPEKPARLITVTVVRLDCPTSSAKLGEERVISKSGPVTIITKTKERDIVPLVPFTVRV